MILPNNLQVSTNSFTSNPPMSPRCVRFLTEFEIPLIPRGSRARTYIPANPRAPTNGGIAWFDQITMLNLFQSLLAAILNDDRAQVKKLLNNDPEIIRSALAEKDRYEPKIAHWI